MGAEARKPTIRMTNRLDVSAVRMGTYFAGGPAWGSR